MNKVTDNVVTDLKINNNAMQRDNLSDMAVASIFCKEVEMELYYAYKIQNNPTNLTKSPIM